MFLLYAINKHGSLVHVGNAPRGKTSGLFCPYCGGDLIARKGTVLAHHFAHAENTCRPVSRDADIIRLPMYEQFSLSLIGREWKALKYFHDKRKLPRQRWLFNRLYEKGLLHYDNTMKRHELTARGKIPFGEATLAAFADVQDDLILEKHTMLAHRVKNSEIDDDAKRICENDLRLYRAQLRRVHSAVLYFLKIDHEAGTLHKIGVTTRTLHDRIAEIQRDLTQHYQQVTITPLLILNNRGAVETYFKFRYNAHNVKLDTLTEYFEFTEPNAVVDELQALGHRALSEFDHAVMTET
ncbi:MAG: competence protein CoiA family protein [Aggregatilineales bacterium]